MERYCVWGPVAPQGVLSSTIISASGNPPPFAQTTVVLTLDPSETLRLPERQWPYVFLKRQSLRTTIFFQVLREKEREREERNKKRVARYISLYAYIYIKIFHFHL